MKAVVLAIQKLEANAIEEIQEKGFLALEINGKSTTLELGDVDISSKDIEGWLVANQGAVTVALDVTVTAPLREEGIARELVNRIQNLRKDSGFEVTDTIEVFLQQHQSMERAVENNLEYIKRETLTHTLYQVKQLASGIDISFDDISSKLYIKKHI